jgi:hypothetical protein
MLFVRSGPGTNYPIRTSSISCNSNRNLYWFTGGTYTNIIQVHQANEGAIDSETWVNIKYNLGGCYSGRSRAVNGTTYDGWGPWVYMEASGEPAIIKTSTLNNTSIEELRTYTADKNSQAKIGVTLNPKSWIGDDYIFSTAHLKNDTYITEDELEKRLEKHDIELKDLYKVGKSFGSNEYYSSDEITSSEYNR